MNISNDSIGAATAYDLIGHCHFLVEKICKVMSLKNLYVLDELWDKISKAERIEQKLTLMLQQKYKEYENIVKLYGKSSFVPLNNPEGIEHDPLKNGFELLNEASGLKLRLKFNELKRVLAQLQNLHETSLQLFDDRLKTYDITLNALSGDDQSQTYGPIDDAGSNHKTGKSVLLNRIV